MDNAKNTGFTLTEMLISLLLSSLLCVVIFKLLIVIIYDYDYYQQRISQQQDLNLAMQYLSDASRRAGFALCLPFSDLPLGNAIDTDGHSIDIRYIKPLAQLSKDSQKNRLYLDRQINPTANQHYFITDCQHWQRFTAKPSNNNKQLIANSLQFQYGKHSLLGQLVEQHYFIQKTHRHGLSGEPISALYLTENDKQELVEHIKQLEVNINQHLITLQLQASDQQQLNRTIFLRNDR